MNLPVGLPVRGEGPLRIASGGTENGSATKEAINKTYAAWYFH